MNPSHLPPNVIKALECAKRCEGSTYRANPEMLEARCCLLNHALSSPDDKTQQLCKDGANKLFWAVYLANYAGALKLVRKKDDEGARMAAEDGLIKAIRTYNPSKGIEFSSWFYRKVRCKLINYSKYTHRQCRNAKQISIDDPSNKLRNNLFLRERRIDYPALGCDISEVLKYLKPREQEVIEYLYGLNGKSELGVNELARKLGITRAGVHFIKTKAISELQGLRPALLEGLERHCAG